MLDKIQKVSKNRIIIAIIVGAVAGISWYNGCQEEGSALIDQHVPQEDVEEE